MLQATTVEKTPLTKQLDRLTNQILVIAGIALVISIVLGLYRNVDLQELFLSAVAFAVAAIPTALPAVDDGHPVEGLPAARRSRGDHEAPALGRDARLHFRAQLRQDRHAHAQPDDRGPDGGRRAALLDLRRRLLDDRADQPYRRPARRAARAVPAADGPLRRRRGPRRGARGRPDRGRARRPRREGRRGPDPHPRAVPAGGDPALRRGLQDDGHLPPDEGRLGHRGHPRVHQGCPGPAPRPRDQRPRPRRHGGPGRPDPRGLSRGERAPRHAGPARHGDRPEGLRPGHLRPGRRPAPAARRDDAARDRRHRGPAAARRQGRHRRRPMRPASRSG